MDEVRIKSAFSKRLLSKILEKILNKKFGPGIDIFINDLEIEKKPDQTCPQYKLTISGEAYVAQTIVEDLICKKRSGSGTN